VEVDSSAVGPIDTDDTRSFLEVSEPGSHDGRERNDTAVFATCGTESYESF